MIKVTIRRKNFPYTRVVTRASSMDQAVLLLQRKDDDVEYTFEKFDEELDNIDVDWEQITENE